MDEARQLAGQGVKELVLIAQNSTAYGHDWDEPDALASLLDRLAAEVPEVPWIRLMYAFPAHVTPRLIETIARNEKVVKYIDLPLQHADASILRAMRRPEEGPGELIRQLRAAVPEIAIRSAFIVGYPGEGERELESVRRFLEEAQLDRVGVFTYSLEEGTMAAELPGQVSKRKAEERYRRVMELQQGISLRKNRAFIGKTLDVLIEGVAEGNTSSGRQKRKARNGGRPNDKQIFVGRSYRDAPEVDGTVLVHGPANIGEIVKVTINEALEYDLIGTVIG
jgi:ribosomal protein S12 methylthiotransferase